MLDPEIYKLMFRRPGELLIHFARLHKEQNDQRQRQATLQAWAGCPHEIVDLYFLDRDNKRVAWEPGFSPVDSRQLRCRACGRKVMSIGTSG